MQEARIYKRGITLVEACIAALLLSIVMAVVMNMFAGGLKGSNKGMAHLTNMQTAALIMSQIEYDLMRATSLNDPAIENSESDARWQITNQDGSTSTIIYRLADGLERQEDNSLTGQSKHVFGRGLNLSALFRQLQFNLPANNRSKSGMWVEITVSSDEDNNEEFKSKRLIVCRNLENSI
ncbi:MAG: PilW family protein [Candidatus Rifleibacteriota bacterium]